MIAELKDIESSNFFDPYRKMPQTIPAAEQDALRAEAHAAIRDAVVPAYARLLAFFRSEYLPKARTTLAAEAMPDGVAWYRQQIRDYTTLDLAPEEIHDLAEDARHMVAECREEVWAALRETKDLLAHGRITGRRI